MTELEPAAQTDLSPAALPRDKNPYWVYLYALDSSTSQATMKGCLDHIAKMLAPELDRDPGELIPWGQLRFEHTAVIRARLLNTHAVHADQTETRWAPSTINKHLSALRGVLRVAWKLEQMSAEDYHRAADVKNVKGGTRRRAGRSIAEKETAAILTVCLKDPDRPRGVRDAAMIAVMQAAGLRRAEVGGLRRRDYEPGDRLLRITGKGGKTREVYLHEVAAEYLGEWLAMTGKITGAMFVPIDRWGILHDRSLSNRAIADILDGRRLEAKLPKLSPHDYRRTFISDLLDEGVDLATAQALAGHASPATTAAYDRRPGRVRKAAIDKRTLPRPSELLPPAPTEETPS